MGPTRRGDGGLCQAPSREERVNALHWSASDHLEVDHLLGKGGARLQLGGWESGGWTSHQCRQNTGTS